MSGKASSSATSTGTRASCACGVAREREKERERGRGEKEKEREREGERERERGRGRDRVLTQRRSTDRLIAAPALARCASVISFFFGTSEDPDGSGAQPASADDAFAALVAADTVSRWREWVRALPPKRGVCMYRCVCAYVCVGVPVCLRVCMWCVCRYAWVWAWLYA